MSFWQKLIAFFTWLFQGNEEARNERNLRKKYEAELKVSSQHEYIKARASQDARVAREKAKIEADRKIEHIKGGGWLGKLSKSIDKPSKGSSKVSKPYKPIDLFPESKTKGGPIDIGKLL